MFFVSVMFRTFMWPLLGFSPPASYLFNNTDPGQAHTGRYDFPQAFPWKWGDKAD
jgi:hypothetical protein